jgi:phage gp29-like protein
LTPEKLAGYFRQADLGDILQQAELFEEMEEKDPILGSVVHTRKLAIQNIEPEILPASDSAEDKKIADLVRGQIDDLDLDDIVLDLMDGLGKGCAFGEIHWDIDGNEARAIGVEWIHQKRFTFAELTAGFTAPLPKLPRLLTDAQPLRGEEVPPWKIIYHRYKARSGFAQRAGLFRGLAYYYLFKNYDVKDWIVFLERFGQPLRLGKYQSSASEPDIDALKEAVMNLGTDAAAVISDSTMIEILEAKTAQASSDMYQRAAEYFDKTYEIAVLGQTATTQGTPGKLGGEDARADVRIDLKKADAKALAKTLRFQLVWPMVGFNFGFDKKLPLLRFPVEDPEDMEKLARMHSTLVDMGVPIPLSFARKKYAIPEPVGGEEVLTPPARPDPFGAPSLFAALGKKKIPVGNRLI